MKASRARLVWVRAIGSCCLAAKQALGWTTVFLLALFSASAATNIWTKPTSGYWEEPYWSLDLPNSSQTVEFTNTGWKALAIGANTVNNYSNSLTVSNLNIDAPSNSFNQLLLNYAGFKAPLTVNSDLTVGTNGSLLSYYTALRGSNFYLNGVPDSQKTRPLRSATLYRDGPRPLNST